jgi:oligoendopeptidase F
LALSVPNEGYSKNAGRTKFDIYVFIESYPYYVTEYKFGIVAGNITAELVKVPRTGMFLALFFVKV